jgi:hypothetical protein
MSVQGLPSLASIFSSIGSICLKLSQSQYDEEALLACAMAKADEKGYFSAASVRDSYTRIKGKKVDIPYFSRHLSAFCQPERGAALIRSGTAKSYEYRFSDPLVRPYTMICGMADGLIAPISKSDAP